MQNPDTYYDRKEVSNSSLSWLKLQLFPREMPDPTLAYLFGNLVDAVITENGRVDYFQKTIDGQQVPAEWFEKAEKMKRSFYADEMCRALIQGAGTQTVMSVNRHFNYKGVEFDLDVRCKWDLFKNYLGFGGDIKSTTATTQAQFEAAVRYFDYDRQRAWYMDIARELGYKADKDVLIGISKVNFKVFKVYINRQSPLYLDGVNKYNFLAFRWWLLYGENKAA